MPQKRIILPPLPHLKEVESHKQDYKGPTAFSNYIIPNILLTGSYPDHKNELKELLENGFTTFVSLEEQFQEQLGSKAKMIKEYKRQGEILAREKKVPFKYNGYHMKNLDKQLAKEVLQFVFDKILKAVDRGEKVYVHDFGGAGRSGVISAIILGILYGLTGGEALGYVGKFHSLRESITSSASPENTNQRLYVYYVIDTLLKEIKIPQWRYIRLTGKESESTPVSNIPDNEFSVFDDQSLTLSPMNQVEMSKKTIGKNISESKTISKGRYSPESKASPSGAKNRNSLNRSFDWGTNVEDDIDLLNDDNIQEFTDLPPEKLKNIKTQKVDNLPFIMPVAPPTADSSMRGPIPQSNWLIKDRVCVGAFPIDTRYGSQRNRQMVIDPKSEACIPAKKLLNSGINVFVCLQAEIPLLNNKVTDESEHISYNTQLQTSQRYGFKDRAGYAPYFDAVESISINELGKKITFIHFPIEEGNTVKPDICSKLLEEIVDRIKLNQRIYIHAGTGHNRESFIGAGLLAVLFNMNASDAIRLMNDLHNIREDTQGVTESPSNHLQKMLVHQMVNAYRGIQSDRITESSRVQAQRDREYSSGNQNRNKNKSTSIIFG